VILIGAAECDASEQLQLLRSCGATLREAAVELVAWSDFQAQEKAITELLFPQQITLCKPIEQREKPKIVPARLGGEDSSFAIIILDLEPGGFLKGLESCAQQQLHYQNRKQTQELWNLDDLVRRRIKLEQFLKRNGRLVDSAQLAELQFRLSYYQKLSALLRYFRFSVDHSVFCQPLADPMQSLDGGTFKLAVGFPFSGLEHF